MEMTPYSALPTLENVYLEDSYVTGFAEGGGEMAFSLLAVLTENHPSYAPPGPDEQYCYRAAELAFPALKRAAWSERHFREYTDADGEVDFGNVDVFYALGDRYHLEGDWGIVDITSDPPLLSLVPDRKPVV